MAAVIGWGTALLVALGVNDWDWGADGLAIHLVAIGVPATMAAAVILDLLARPGSLAFGERAGLVVTPRPIRAIRRRISVLRRYRELVRLCREQGFGPFLSAAERAERTVDAPGVRLRRVLEQAGGVYVKLGQIAATRVDLLPPDICNELAELQNRVPAEPRDRIAPVLEEELGAAVDEVFAEFDWEPLAAASIGQTYRARLHSGESVVVKVQRPDIEVMMERDLAALALLANMAQRRTPFGQGVRSGDLLAQFAMGLRKELDFRHEADAMSEMAALLGDRSTVRVPAVYRDLSTRRVLVQERFEGVTVSDIGRLDGADVDRHRLADQLLRATLDQIIRIGVFHADPHPGNVFVLAGGELGLIDFGAVGRLDPIEQAAIVDIMVALARRDVSLLRDGVERVAEFTDTTSPDELERALARLMADHVRPGASVDPAVFDELVATLSRFGMRLPTDVVLLSRALVTVDGTLRVLVPDLAFVAAAMKLVERKDDDRPVVDRQRVARSRSCCRCSPICAACPTKSTASSRSPGEASCVCAASSTRTAGGSCAPSPTVCCSCSPGLRSSPRRPGCWPRPTRARVSPGRPGCSRRSATAVCSSERCSCCGWWLPSLGTARHERRACGGDHRRRPARQQSFDDRPPGERYFRHPGDVIRVVVWGLVTFALLVFIELAEGTNAGLRDDLADVVGPDPGRSSPAGRHGRPARRHPRPTAFVVVALVAAAGGGADSLHLTLAAVARGRRLRPARCAFGIPGSVAEALEDDFWLIPARFPSPLLLAGAAAAVAVGKPWLSTAWRRSVDRWLVVVAVAILVAGTAGLAEVLLAVAAGTLAGAAVLVVLGAPESPADAACRRRRARAVRPAGDRARPSSGRPAGDRSCIERRSATARRPSSRSTPATAGTPTGSTAAIALLVLREPGDDWLGVSLERSVEHEGLLLLLARRAGVRCPDLRAVVAVDDGSMVLAMEDVGGRQLDTLSPDECSPELLDAVWTETRTLHAAGIAHRALRAANIVVDDDGPVIVDFGSAAAAADGRLQAFDRAELVVVAGHTRRSRGGHRSRGAHAAGRRPRRGDAVRPTTGVDRRHAPAGLEVAAQGRARRTSDEATGLEPEPLERLVRVRPRTLLMIATLTGAFYFLLPQLANVDDSIEAIRSANWGWLAGCVVDVGRHVRRGRRRL